MGLEISSHLHPVGSFDLADHDVPTGREEVWRFTPVKRLKGLHNGRFSGDGKVVVDVDTPPEVSVEAVERSDSRLGSVFRVPMRTDSGTTPRNACLGRRLLSATRLTAHCGMERTA